MLANLCCRPSLLSVFVGCMIFILAVVPVSANVSLPNLPPGSQYQLAFLTSDQVSGFYSDVSVYNNFVRGQAAGSSSLPLATWYAFVSTPTVNAIDNVPTSLGIPIYNTLGQRVADGKADFWSATHLAPINGDQSGQNVTGSYGIWPAWSGTNWDGTALSPLGTPPPCFAEVGNAAGTRYWATHAISDTSSNRWQMYAISSIITVAPEPSELTLLAAGAIGLLGLARWRALI